MTGIYGGEPTRPWYPPGQLAGMPFVESVHAVNLTTSLVRRSWRERLLTRPWRPWRGRKAIVEAIPCAIRVGNRWVVHPAIAAELRRLETLRGGRT